MTFASDGGCPYVAAMMGQGQQVSTARLVLADLACWRGGRRLFSGVNLALEAGGAATLAGPNGVGKSSLLRLIAGLLEPEAGLVETVGRIALADEGLALDPMLTLSDALGFWAKLDGGKVAGALESLDLAHLAEVPVRILSTGQRKRAVLARTLASGAELWLLDEPGNGLDADSLQSLARVIADHRLRGGIVLAASHQPLGIEDAPEIRLEVKG